MKTVIGVLVLVLGMSVAHAGERSMVEKLTIIADPDWGDRDRVKRRLGYLLPQIANACGDMKGETQVGDRLAFAYGKIEEAGVNESLLAMAEGLNRAASATRSVGRRCTAILAGYILSRQNGFGTDESWNAATLVALTQDF